MKLLLREEDDDIEFSENESDDESNDNNRCKNAI